MILDTSPRNWKTFVILLCVAALPMLVVTIPSAADYPNHLARHHVFLSAVRGNALNSYFVINWRWIGNLGVDLPVMGLAPWLGVENATRLVSAMIAPLTLLGIVMLSRSAHGRVTGSAMLSAPFALAQPFLYGFLNYCLAVALALILAALWNSDHVHSRARQIGFAAGALIVFTAHIMGWGLLLLLVAGAELPSIRQPRDAGRSILRVLPLLAPIIPMLAWRSTDAGRLYWYEPHLLSSKLMNFVTALKGLSLPLDLGMTAALGIASVIAFAWAAGRKIEPRLGAGGALLMLATLLLPTTILGSWGADLRLAPIAMMIVILSIGPADSPNRERFLLATGICLFLLRASWTTVQWSTADRVLQQRLAILDQVPFGSRLGFISVGKDCHTGWAWTPDRKLGAYAVTRRDSFSNTLFQIPGSDLMTMRDPADRARWFDGSQDIRPICPAGVPDLAAAGRRIAEMSEARFGHIWVAGLAGQFVTVPRGYAIAYTKADDTLLQAATDNARYLAPSEKLPLP